ncbi:unnamed protein product [Calypogeia fissa]
MNWTNISPERLRRTWRSHLARNNPPTDWSPSSALPTRIRLLLLLLSCSSRKLEERIRTTGDTPWSKNLSMHFVSSRLLLRSVVFQFVKAMTTLLNNVPPGYPFPPLRKMQCAASGDSSFFSIHEVAG